MENPIQEQTQKEYGPIIGIIIVIIIFVAGGIYLLTSGSQKPEPATIESEITIIEKDIDSSINNLTSEIDVSDLDVSMGK